MTQVTPASIAYISTQVFPLLSYSSRKVNKVLTGSIRTELLPRFLTHRLGYRFREVLQQPHQEKFDMSTALGSSL